MHYFQTYCLAERPSAPWAILVLLTAMSFCSAGWFTESAWDKLERQVDRRFKLLVVGATSQAPVGGMQDLPGPHHEQQPASAMEVDV